MQAFELNHTELESSRKRAAERAAAGEGAKLAERLRGGAALDDESLATLLLASDVETDALLDLAKGLREAAAQGRGASSGPRIETFSPLYITNTCDAECVMCGMRRANTDLERATADAGTVEEQLDILHARGLRGVAILTGEYRPGKQRTEMLARTAEATKAAIERASRTF